VGAAAAMIASSLVERSLEAGWKAATNHQPPRRPDSPNTRWREALIWTGASALAIGLAQVAARRGAAIGWQHATGKKAPV
ncbi:MAG: DUF4235 domain-containing protein, partial [Thermoanaerobaculia bacterium]